MTDWPIQFDEDARPEDVALAAAPTWANSALALVEVTGRGQYPVVTPDGLLAGEYDAVVYSGSPPLNIDETVIGFDVRVGGIFGF